MKIESLIKSYSDAISAIDTNDYKKQIDKAETDIKDSLIKLGNGASLGAAVGSAAISFVPGIGTAVGAGVGGVIGAAGALGSIVFDDLDAGYEIKEIKEQVTKMRTDCSTLASMITGNTNNKISVAITNLENAKKIMSKQIVQSSNGKNQKEELIKLINKEISNLKRLRELNTKFVAKLHELGNKIG